MFDYRGAFGRYRLQGVESPSGDSLTISWVLGDSIIIDLENATDDVTLTLNSAEPGGSYIIKAIQGSTQRDLVWPASVKWDVCGGTPVVPATENHELLVSLFYDGINFYGGYRIYS